MRGCACCDPPPVEAAQAAVALPPQSTADCTGTVPIVVASDAAAQSDLYSAVTLAGVIGTDCIILAGPRDQPIPSNQQARLDAAATGGYIVGGTAAVPQAKLSFAQHAKVASRIAGADRWATAVLVGVEAAKAAGSTSPSNINASAGAHRPDTDCAGDVPIVVASDAAAESDLYSAVTLAGVIGTDCIVLAGPRDQPIPASQQARLAAVAEGGYIVGGTAAVPPAKLVGRTMTRLAGADRWATAALVGTEATNIAEGSPTPPTPQSGEFARETTGAEIVHGDGRVACARHADGTTECRWSATLEYDAMKHEIPISAEAALQIAGNYPCELRSDGSLTCWSLSIDVVTGDDGEYTVRSSLEVAVKPEGAFASVHAGPSYNSICAIRSDNRALDCWVPETSGALELANDTPAGSFLTLSRAHNVACGLRTDRTIACWGNPSGVLVKNDQPDGPFSSIEVSYNYACGLQSDHTIACWGDPEAPLAFSTPPSGTFTSIRLSWTTACGLRTDGTIACWGDARSPAVTDTPTGTFVDSPRFLFGGNVACGQRTDRTIACWGAEWSTAVNNTPMGAFTTMIVYEGELGIVCGVRDDGTIHCDFVDERGSDFFANVITASVAPPHAALSTSGSGHRLCALNSDGAFECWDSGGIGG